MSTSHNAFDWRSVLPPLQWLSAYQAQWLTADIIAGITLAAYAIPVSMAYAALAGLPPHHGIYGYLLGGLFYAAFGTSRQLAMGPTSAIALLVGVAVADMAGGVSLRAVEIAALAALVVAGLGVLAWLLRLSQLVCFISDTILLGFKAGAALTIAMTQLPKLFGVAGGGDNFFDRVWTLIGQLGATNLVVLGLGLVALILMGDEVRHTQGGNNNAYCQDNEISWFDWSKIAKHADVHRFLKLLIERRLLRDVEHEQQRMSLTKMIDQANKAWHGVRLFQPDWGDGSHSVALEAELKKEGLRFFLILNAYWGPLHYELPKLDGAAVWRRWIDTGLDSPNDIVPWRTAPEVSTDAYPVEARSVVMLFASSQQG